MPYFAIFTSSQYLILQFSQVLNALFYIVTRTNPMTSLFRTINITVIISAVLLMNVAYSISFRVNGLSISPIYGLSNVSPKYLCGPPKRHPNIPASAASGHPLFGLAWSGPYFITNLTRSRRLADMSISIAVIRAGI